MAMTTEMTMKQNDNEIMTYPLTMKIRNEIEIMTSQMTMKQNANETKWQWKNAISNDNETS